MTKKVKYVGTAKCFRCNLPVPVARVRRGLREHLVLVRHLPDGINACGTAGNEVKKEELLPQEALA